MLWQRLITALVLVPLVVAGILYLDTGVLATVIGVIVLVGAYEMARLANLHSRIAQGGFILAVALAQWLAWQYLQPDHLGYLQWTMAVWWTFMTLALVSRRSELPRIHGTRPGVLVLGGLVLVTAWSSIMALHAAGERGPILMLFLFVLIWVADSGAYFAGRAFGRRKLSPFVSPGKTWAGAGGAAAGAVVSAMFLAAGGAAGAASLAGLIGLSLLVTAVSIGGDLWESLLKREAGVKDSGNLLPGHGGVLDRIDSLLAAAPVFALGAGLVGLLA
ncbi:MAG: phosphatidate cytidylyltransferase [Gammaproteobacteria bacterium]|nr:phosphatidate cytidylyltransferase [Gammaproteobacteria bacterium]